MGREFEARRPDDTITLRDWLAMHMPKPPTYLSDPPGAVYSQEEWFAAELEARYAWADRIMKEIR